MSSYDVPAVGVFGGLLEEMLERGKSVTQAHMAEPPMSKPDIMDLMARFDSIFPHGSSLEQKKRVQFPVIETAIRDKFNNLLVSSMPKPSKRHTSDGL